MAFYTNPRISTSASILLFKLLADIVLIDTKKDKPLGYYSDLSNAIQKISRLGLANQKEEFTLAGFIESFNNIRKKLTKSIKN